MFGRGLGLLVVLCGLAVGARGDARLEAIVRGDGPAAALSGLQVSLLEGGTATAGFAYGFAQLGPDGPVPLRRDHRVRVASISKLVVAIGVMRLVEQGRLDLDADVSETLGYTLRNPAYADTPITARQLLTHTSSIRDGSAYFIPAGRGEMRDFFTPGGAFWDDGAHFAGESGRGPGAFFTYANLGFGVLAALIERATDQRFDLFMARSVLEPLGIAARFDPCAIGAGQLAAAFRKRASGEVWDPDGPWRPQVDAGTPRCFYGMDDLASAEDFLAGYEPGSNATLFSPQGGLRASADDLVVVLRMLAGGGVVDGRRILSEASVAAMLAPEWTLASDGGNGLSAGEAEPGGPTEGLMTSYGLSVHRIDMRAWGFERGPALMVGHLGEAYGVLSHALLDPETGDGIATIITGTADDPAVAQPGTSPLYRVEEEILRWWLARREAAGSPAPAP
ncbi:MAG: serine hydrolase domain-containing protein [Pseudomonadales bacterium]|jgi:CubicO group peptidase (beta-lactamase class C family)|nr:serine hydrolase domain-containing protein [Pseudomonadales bacterium]